MSGPGVGGGFYVAVKDGGGAPLSGGLPGIWDPSRSHLRVVLRDVVTEVRVGLHPWEQHAERPTRVIVNVEMFAPVGQGLAAEDEAGLVNYDLIHAALRSWPAKPHTGLLETLLHELVTLCFVSPRVAACRVSILKPDIFNDAAAVGVEAYVLRHDHVQGGAA